jgi:hypothetical protein
MVCRRWTELFQTDDRTSHRRIRKSAWCLINHLEGDLVKLTDFSGVIQFEVSQKTKPCSKSPPRLIMPYICKGNLFWLALILIFSPGKKAGIGKTIQGQPKNLPAVEADIS